MRKWNSFLILFLLTVCTAISLLGVFITPADGQEVFPVISSSKYIHSLTPNTDGPGLVVGDPVPVNCDASAEDFGTECSYWLQIVVGGEGALGQTPLVSEIGSTRRYVLRSPNHRYLPAQVPVLAKNLGVGCVATSRLVAHGDSYVLSYSMTAPTGKLLGPPIAASGSLADILSALPSIARKMAALLGVADTSGIPNQISASTDDMTAIGQCDLSAKLTPDQINRLKEIAPRSLLAGLLLVTDRSSDEPINSQLLEQAHGNALLLCVLRMDSSGSQPEIDGAIDDALRAHPKNYALITASAYRFFYTNDMATVRKREERAVCAAPSDPWAWIALGIFINDQADQVRQGRYYSDMSDKEAEQIGTLYPLWEATAVHAASLAPGNAMALQQLAAAATFNGDDEVADKALWEDIHLNPAYIDSYNWGLEMYQHKWTDQPLKLIKIARLIENDPALAKALSSQVIDALSTLQANDAGYAEAQDLIRQAKSQTQSSP